MATEAVERLHQDVENSRPLHEGIARVFSPFKRELEHSWVVRREKVQEVQAAAEVNCKRLPHVHTARPHHTPFEDPVEDEGHRAFAAPLRSKGHLILLPCDQDGLEKVSGASLAALDKDLLALGTWRSPDRARSTLTKRAFVTRIAAMKGVKTELVLCSITTIWAEGGLNKAVHGSRWKKMHGCRYDRGPHVGISNPREDSILHGNQPPQQTHKPLGHCMIVQGEHHRNDSEVAKEYTKHGRGVAGEGTS